VALKRSCSARLAALTVLALALAGMTGCSSKLSQPESNPKSAPPASTSTAPNGMPYLAEAMDKLQTSLEKPAAPFHVSFKKARSDGFSYACEADVSSAGIVGEQTDVAPETKLGTDTFPAHTDTKKINGAPPGSQDWNFARTTIALAYLNGHIGDAQEGVKAAGEETVGGYAARRYDFDIANLDTVSKRAMTLGNAAYGSGGRHLNDYNVKGSAWIAKDDGRMVKFQFDSIMAFSDGEKDTTHYEGAVTKK
jgi:hypothetical protein